MDKKHDDDIQCSVCGEWVYPGNLELIFWHDAHEGNKPTEPSKYKSKLINSVKITGIKEPQVPEEELNKLSLKVTANTCMDVKNVLISTAELDQLISTIRQLKKTQITEAEKDALAFYGDPENYHNTEGDEWPSDVQMDEGETARDARNG